MIRRYKWLFFDADGTLFDYERAEAVALERTFLQAGVPYRPEYLPAYQQVNQQMWKALEAGTMSPAVLRVRRFELLLDVIGHGGDAQAFSDSYLANLSECTQLIEGAHELVDELHPHYQIAIVTNGLSVVQRPRIANSPIRDYVADLVISEEIGTAKPHAGFFDTAFERMGNPAKSEVLMIGDSLTSDIVGACGYGLDTCWYNPHCLPRPADIAITYEIRRLGELLDILK